MGNGALYRDFIYPPFSVFDARAGWWRERKNAWLATGIESEKGRKTNLLNGFGDALARFDHRKSGKPQKAKESADKSVFDPVLCELLYAWFCPRGGTVLDPFAGGSVRGIVAGMMDRKYVGVEIRPEQVQENIRQANHLKPGRMPKWIVGDGTRTDRLWRGRADFILSCPPYGDLEKYSDDPADISNMSYDMFIGAFRTAIKAASKRLRDDRFASFIVGDFRDRSGLYRGFVRDTITACADAELLFYNDAVLVTAGGSLPLRARGGFEASRKLGKGHQNVLVFVKGDPVKARKDLGNVEPCEAISRY